MHLRNGQSGGPNCDQMLELVIITIVLTSLVDDNRIVQQNARWQRSAADDAGRQSGKWYASAAACC